MTIEPDLVTKLADLARLELTPEEEAAFGEQLPAIVSYVSALQAANIETVPTESHPDEAQRTDSIAGRSTPEVVIAQAPVRQDDFWKVDSVKG